MVYHYILFPATLGNIPSLECIFFDVETDNEVINTLIDLKLGF